MTGLDGDKAGDATRKVRYAAYGSNLHPLRLRLRTPTARLLGTTQFKGRVLRFHKRSLDGSAKCDAAAGPGECYVAVYEIERAELETLNRIEGVGQGYELASIRVPGYGDCMTYLAAETHIDPTLLPYGWYKALVLAGCRELDFPAPYIAEIASIPSIDDPDDDRHADNMKIVADLV